MRSLYRLTCQLSLANGNFTGDRLTKVIGTLSILPRAALFSERTVQITCKDRLPRSGGIRYGQKFLRSRRLGQSRSDRIHAVHDHIFGVVSWRTDFLNPPAKVLCRRLIAHNRIDHTTEFLLG